jgi:hypothetical protein
MNENLPDVSGYEKELAKIEKDLKKTHWSDYERKEKMARCDKLKALISEGHNYRFIGRVGQFCPVKAGCGGGLLMREQDGKYYAATGSTGYRWLESEMVRELGKEKDIDRSYYDNLVDKAVEAISEYGDFEWFISDDSEEHIEEKSKKSSSDVPPWQMPCGDENIESCFHCPHFDNDEFHMDCGFGHDISDIIIHKKLKSKK